MKIGENPKGNFPPRSTSLRPTFFTSENLNVPLQLLVAVERTTKKSGMSSEENHYAKVPPPPHHSTKTLKVGSPTKIDCFHRRRCSQWRCCQR